MKSTRSQLSSQFFAVIAATIVLTGTGTIANIAAGTLTPAYAQDQPGTQPPASGGHGRMGKMLMSLDLSDAQKTQIRAIIADAHKQNQTVTDRDQKRANMKAAYAKVETVLTPAQRTELHAKMDAMRQQNQPAHTQ